MKYETREDWLVAAVEVLRPHFEKIGYKIPALRVSCGWPHAGGLGAKKKVLGQCWTHEASADGKFSIFVSPTIEDDPKEDYAALPVFIHEICHACVGIEAKHGAEFKKCAEGVGLTGKMTSTVPGDDLKLRMAEWRTELGPYPHVKLNPEMRPTKKQTTRMFKCECKVETCGYQLRISRKWLDDVGNPHCPKHGRMESDYIGSEGEGEE